MRRLREIMSRSDREVRLRFKTGEFVYDEHHRADIIARLEMWLIDEEYMAKIDVHGLIRDALHEIGDLRVKNAETRALISREQSLADALAFATSGLIALVPDETIESLGEFRQKIEIALNAWQRARHVDE